MNKTGKSNSAAFQNQGAANSSAKSATNGLEADQTEMSIMNPSNDKRSAGYGSTLEQTFQGIKNGAQVEPTGNGLTGTSHGTGEESSTTHCDAKQ